MSDGKAGGDDEMGPSEPTNTASALFRRHPQVPVATARIDQTFLKQTGRGDHEEAVDAAREANNGSCSSRSRMSRLTTLPYPDFGRASQK